MTNPSPSINRWLSLPRRLAYRTAYGAATLVWRLLQIETRGALVAVWQNGDILLVKNSYRAELSLPGGLMDRSDRQDSQRTAQRELVEEVGISAGRDDLQFHSRDRRKFEGHMCRTDFYELHLTALPVLTIDGREIDAAHFMAHDAALAEPLVPMVRDYLLQRQSPLDQCRNRP